MANRLVFDGLEQLKADLRNLPADLGGDARDPVFGSADEAGREIVDGYPTRTGKLKNGVKVVKTSDTFGARATVKNTAKHANIFEVGTQARHTAIGANRGSMPAGHVFIPIIMRKRRAMYEKLKALLVRHGLTVSGDA